MDFTTIMLIGVAIVGIIVAFIFFSFISVWIKAALSGAYVGITNLVAMRLRGVPYSIVVDARITAVKAGIELSVDEIEAHFLAGGNLIPTVQAIIAAMKAGIELNWNRACAIDLATKGSGKSVVEAVRTSVDPKVIDCPSVEGSKKTIDGVAKDGIQVKARARVTVRTNLDRFVGGAKEETVIARVGEGIVTTIGSAESYKVVLESPDSISKVVLERGLDVGTAFEILSIDIADVDVGENVGAALQEAQAEANKNMAQAKAEMRRAAAVAAEQEMKARVEEMRAKVVEAEAQVPLAMAEAFRSGNLGIMDYYKMKNIESDTSMRQSIADGDEDGSEKKD
ncbi:flotillin-like protein FloA [Puniceicoccaceae bacterium K14]|nr:flotillin-like protein FloA [Puniceicoccaceae bacterium K14]